MKQHISINQVKELSKNAKMSNKKLRVSFSLLSAWEQGDIDRAVATYFHLPGYATQAMLDGRAKHEEIAEYVTANGKLPEYLPQFELNKPEAEIKLIVEYSDRYDLSAVIDLLDLPAIFEWKTGTTDALSNSHTKQIPFYFLACQLAGYDVDRAYLVNHNQYEDKNNWVVYWNSEMAIEKAKKYIDSLAPEIEKHFRDEGLLYLTK